MADHPHALVRAEGDDDPIVEAPPRPLGAAPDDIDIDGNSWPVERALGADADGLDGPDAEPVPDYLPRDDDVGE